MRLALIAHRLGAPPAFRGSGRGVRELETEAQRAVALRTDSEMPRLGAMLPELLVDLLRWSPRQVEMIDCRH